MMYTILKNEVIIKENISHKEDSQLLKKEILDRYFPLDKGSHKDVVSYEVDYCHLLAYFKDGSHSGLVKQRKFVAYKGNRLYPEAILFKTAKGLHVELVMDNNTLSDYKLHNKTIEGIYYIYKIEDFESKSGGEYKPIRN